MLSVTDLISHYRLKAMEFNQKADALEADLKTLGLELKSATPKLKLAPSGLEFTRQNVHSYLRKHGARIQGLSAAFAVTVSMVEAFVADKANRVHDKGRGWLEVIEDSAANNQLAEGEHV